MATVSLEDSDYVNGFAGISSIHVRSLWSIFFWCWLWINIETLMYMYICSFDISSNFYHIAAKIPTSGFPGRSEHLQLSGNPLLSLLHSCYFCFSPILIKQLLRFPLKITLVFYLSSSVWLFRWNMSWATLLDSRTPFVDLYPVSCS